MKKLFLFLLVIFILGILVISGCAPAEVDLGPGEYDEFAKCLYDSGVRIYGSYICSVCAKQRDLFGNSFQYVQEIECHPRGENPQTDRCLAMDIAKTPTWILEEDGVEIKRLEGYQKLGILAEFSGCTLDNG